MCIPYLYLNVTSLINFLSVDPENVLYSNLMKIELCTLELSLNALGNPDARQVYELNNFGRYEINSEKNV